jgi:hypothetical protein
MTGELAPPVADAAALAVEAAGLGAPEASGEDAGAWKAPGSLAGSVGGAVGTGNTRSVSASGAPRSVTCMALCCPGRARKNIRLEPIIRSKSAPMMSCGRIAYPASIEMMRPMR